MTHYILTSETGEVSTLTTFKRHLARVQGAGFASSRGTGQVLTRRQAAILLLALRDEGKGDGRSLEVRRR